MSQTGVCSARCANMPNGNAGAANRKQKTTKRGRCVCVCVCAWVEGSQQKRIEKLRQ